MDNLTDISVIKQIMSSHGFTFSKALGQNFLTNPSVCPKMAELCCDTDCGVIEIGPGVGVLTNELCKRAKKVVAIELDDRLLPVLQQTLAEHDNLTVIHGDVLKLDLAQIIAEHFDGMRVSIAGNLPYYITSPIIMGLLEKGLPIESVTAMVQREAAERICAMPGTRDCGAISAAVWYYSTPQIMFRVSRGSFMPAPKVESAVIKLDIRKSPPVELDDRAMFFRLVKAAFSQRRKTAANSVSNMLGLGKDAIYAAMDICGIEKNSRAEQLSLEMLASLSNELSRAPK